MPSRMLDFITYCRSRLEDIQERAPQRAWNDKRIELLRRFIARHGTGAELGVHRGCFSLALLEALAPTKLYLVDPWYLHGKQWHWGKGDRSTMNALCRILHTMEDELVAGRLVLVIDDDLQALSKIPNDHLDWAYLDTTHQYEHTVKELDLLKVKVKAAGVIAGDDWQSDPSHRHHGVCKAVREFIDREPYKLLYSDEASRQWAVSKRMSDPPN
jgi:Methyltransferase domain